MISIRRATPEDAATVHGLLRELAGHQDQAWAVTVGVPGLRPLLSRPEVTYLIAERDGRAVGYVSWLERAGFWSGEDYLHLDDLYVTGAERGHGVGERLMRAVADAAAGRVIRWEVAETNEAAQRFYKRIGATLVSKKIGRWQPG
ncbi:GNAT family N-acetyltransferase [Streptosporangium sp. NPDC048865]|uniref:GNAT family N-acetyltransferase n=1 Tax=Streptosporangium sp. NPDC048865 TaxID=3155766 RepID=UPI003418A772